MFSAATGRSAKFTRYPNLSPTGPRRSSGARTLAFRIASARIRNAVITVDFPALFGPTSTLNDERATEYCLKALKFRKLTDVNLSTALDLPRTTDPRPWRSSPRDCLRHPHEITSERPDASLANKSSSPCLKPFAGHPTPSGRRTGRSRDARRVQNWGGRGPRAHAPQRGVGRAGRPSARTSGGAISLALVPIPLGD